MITKDKTIGTPQYWDDFYSGKRNDAKVDNSDRSKPSASFDRLGEVLKHVEGPIILDLAAGNAQLCKRIKAIHPDWTVYASDHSQAAKKAANYEPYFICDARKTGFNTQEVDMVICCQAMEYMEDNDAVLKEASRIGNKFLCTVPLGEMSSWSQLRIYEPDSFRQFLSKYGDIEHFQVFDHMILAKIRFK